MTAALLPFLDGSHPLAFLVTDDLLTANTLFDAVAAASLTVADDPVAPATTLDSADTATFPIPQYLFSNIILHGADPATLGVPPDQISAVTSLDGFGPTTLSISHHIVIGYGR
jgi:hypothetical protein